MRKTTAFRAALALTLAGAAAVAFAVAEHEPDKPGFEPIGTCVYQDPGPLVCGPGVDNPEVP